MAALRREILALRGPLGAGVRTFHGQEPWSSVVRSASAAGSIPGKREVHALPFSASATVAGSFELGTPSHGQWIQRRLQGPGLAHASPAVAAILGVGCAQQGDRGFATFPWFGSGAAKDLDEGGAPGEPVSTENVTNSVAEDFSAAAAGVQGTGTDHVDFANTVLDTLHQAEAMAQLAAVDNSWWLTGKLIQGMCYVTDAAGIPWWFTIAATTFSVRLAIFPMMVWMESAKVAMQKIQPEMETIKQKYPGLYQGDKAAQEAFSRETNALFARHKTSPASALMMMPLSLSQVFIFGTFFFSLQNLCAAKLPSLMTGGVAWFTDLTVPDSTYLLPAAGAALMLATVELGAADMGSSDTSAFMKSVMRVMSAAFLAMGGYLPSGMFIYFVTTNGFTLGQVAVLRSPTFRRMVGLPKVQPPAAASGKSKHESLTEMYKRYLLQADEVQTKADSKTPKTFSVRHNRRRKGSTR